MKIDIKILTALMLTMITSLLAWSVNMLNAADSPPLKLTLSTMPDTKYTVGNIPLKLTFQNTSEGQIRILDCFNDPQALRIFFWFDVRRDNGEVVYIPGGGKISISKGDFKYITLEKDGKFELLINLNDIMLPSTEKKAGVPNTELRVGTYSIFVTYHNQYGDDCFKGFINGNTIKVNITE